MDVSVPQAPFDLLQPFLGFGRCRWSPVSLPAADPPTTGGWTFELMGWKCPSNNSGRGARDRITGVPSGGVHAVKIFRLRSTTRARTAAYSQYFCEPSGDTEPSGLR